MRPVRHPLGALTRQLCLALTAHEHELLLHGVETGRIMRSPEGGYTEVHVPLDEAHRAILAHDRSGSAPRPR